VYVFIPFSYIIVGYIIWKTNEEYPDLIKNIFKYAVSVFFIALIVLIAMPFFLKLSWITVALSGLLLVVFIIFYNNSTYNKAWAFCLGLVLLRLIYAAAIIPVQEKLIRVNYRDVGASMAKANKGMDFTYWAESQHLDVGLNLKFLKFKLDSVVSPPFIYYQIPYYSYYQTKQVIHYDTTLQPNKTYLSYGSNVKGKNVSLLWSWYDVRQKAQFILFRTNDQQVHLP
jgi:hypothetical protein